MSVAKKQGPYIVICKNCLNDFEEKELTPEVWPGDFCSDTCEREYKESDDYLEMLFDDEKGGEG